MNGSLQRKSAPEVLYWLVFLGSNLFGATLAYLIMGRFRLGEWTKCSGKNPSSRHRDKITRLYTLFHHDYLIQGILVESILVFDTKEISSTIANASIFIPAQSPNSCLYNTLLLGDHGVDALDCECLLHYLVLLDYSFSSCCRSRLQRWYLITVHRHYGQVSPCRRNCEWTIAWERIQSRVNRTKKDQCSLRVVQDSKLFCETT